MTRAFIGDAIRTPFGRCDGALSPVLTGDLAELPIKALMARHADLDWAARLRRALPLYAPGRRGQPKRRAHGGAARRPAARRSRRDEQPAVWLGDGRGGQRGALLVMPKAETAFQRANAVHETTIGQRFDNRLMKGQYDIDSMRETAENVAAESRIRDDAQERMALASQTKAIAVQKAGFFDAESRR